MDKVLAKSVHLGLGLDLLGSKMSLNANPRTGTELEVTALGVKCSNQAGRIILVPWANIKGVELLSSDGKGSSGSPAAAKPLPAKPKPVAKD